MEENTETFTIEVDKITILRGLTANDVIKHFGLKQLIGEMDSSEVIEAIGYKESLRVIDIDDAIEFLEKEGFLVTEK